MTRLRYQAYGLAFVVVLALLVGIAVAAYQKRFTPVVDVSVKAQTVGTQLNVGGDVKVRGVIVGEIREITSTGKAATVRLALQPEQAKRIPAGSSARFVPKTLFGERYVDLRPPRAEAGRSLQPGDVIPEDRSAAAIALNRVLDDVLPLLRTLEPAKVQSSLNAMATALEGRGDDIGDNLERLDAYLKQLNPHMPALKHDIKRLGEVAEVYDEVVPDLAKTLRHLSKTAKTVTEKERTIQEFLTATTGFSVTTRSFLVRHEERLIMVGDVGRPTLELMAQYAPEYPCLLEGLVKSEQKIGKVFERKRLHITMEIIKSRPPYEPGVDAPEWNDKRGPGCYGLPNPKVPYPGMSFKDGTEDDEYNTGGDESGVPGLSDPSGRVTATTQEKRMVGSLIGPTMGESPDDVPDIGTLLFGPMARGTKVSYS
ncbi:MAG: MCE family protein [Streptosporangiales bacterium]|nr:MCE family protein [Streptosporangiales bacterium]